MKEITTGEWYDITMSDKNVERIELFLTHRPMNGDVIIKSIGRDEYQYIEVVRCVHSPGNILTLICKPFIENV